MAKRDICIDYDKAMQTEKISLEIPFIQFPSNWKIKIVPPFSGASIRFYVQDQFSDEKFVSIYLDWFSMLGSVDEPYWEVYRYKEDVCRVLLNDVDDLIEAIKLSLNEIAR